MNGLILIVKIAGERVAFPTEDVESVVELEGLTPVPRAAAHVAGLSALRSRVLTGIDCLSSLELAQGEAMRDAVVVEVEGHPYALAVEQVLDVAETDGHVEPVRTQLGAGWSRVARGMTEAGGELLLLVDPKALIVGPQAEAA